LQDNLSHDLNLPLMEKSNSSLPLVIAVVLQYWGEDILYLEKNNNQNNSTNIIDGIEFAKKKRYSSYIYKSSIKDLKKRIDQGIPPIVIFPGLYHLTQHALLISGYDDNEKRISSYIPQPDTKGSIPEIKFLSEWTQEDNITIMIIPEDMKNLFSEDALYLTKSYKLCFEAEKDFSNGNIESAIQKVTQSINIDKNNAFAWSLLGSCYSEANNQECITCFTKAINLNSNYFLAFKGIGNFYLKIKDYQNAEKYYSQAIEINPNRYGPIYKNRALSRLQMNEKQKAKQDLILYLEKTPNAQDKKQITEALKSL
jgi:tetratricopeptide (TPR) repeat protein